MSNETYLIVSYFAVGMLCLGLALAASRWLRRPAEGIADSLPHESWKKFIRRAFPLSTVLFVLSSCLSVDYYGCGMKNYQGILADRSYIVARNAEQISKALQAIIWSVGVWSIILVVALRVRRPIK